ncbi:MAG: Gfo/Idh/MocA family oxidoreductase, partial [Gemmatimonadota bacterium]|nr:Gfo/Idh/MocA family oxidoreductase [Gemmatimonadota bacterium]
MADHVGVGLIGSQFISTIHAEALKSVPDAKVLAAMSPTAGHARDFAARHGIPHHFTDLDALLAVDDIDMVIVGVPNFLHCDITLRAAAAGKHVVMEKPLCLNLAEADRMIAACKRANVKLMY